MNSARYKNKSLAAIALVATMIVYVVVAPSFARSERVTAQQAEMLSSNRHMLLLEYHIYSDDIVGDGEFPRLQIFADGSVLVNFPPYMKAGGNYVATLGAEEISDISLKLTSNTAMLLSAFSGREQPEPVGTEMLSPDRELQMLSHQMLFELVLHPSLFALDPNNMQSVSSPVRLKWANPQSQPASAGTAEALDTLSDISGLLDEFISRANPGSD